MKIPLQTYERWILGGSLLVALLTRQMAVGLVPLVWMHGRWQRQQWKEQLVDHLHRRDQEWNQRWQILERQMLQQVEQHLHSQPVASNPTQAAHLHLQLTQLGAEVQALAEQVQQLQAQPRSHLSIQQQMAPLHQRMRLIQQEWQRLRLETVGRLRETQQQLQEQVQHLQLQLQQVQQQVEQAQQVQQKHRSGVGIFIDGANLHASAYHLGMDLNYEQLIPYLLGSSSTAAEIHFYSGWDPSNREQTRFHRYLKEQLGFQIHRKRVVHFDGGGSKANMDGQMIVDLLRSNYERVILLSGDGDFLPALEQLRSEGIPVTVAAFGQDTHREMRRNFPFVDLAQVLSHGQKVIPLPAKQVPSVGIS